MPAMTCHPGQDVGPVPTVACAGMPVVLRPDGDSFPAGRETLWLESSHEGKDDMTVIHWSENAIIALVPLNNPGDGEEGETFTVWFQGADYFTASPVLVVGPAGNYPDPPTHFVAQFKSLANQVR